MLNQSAFLDLRYRESIEQIAIEAGWVTNDSDGDPIELPTQRNHLRKKTLLLMTLFDKLDSSHSDYDLGRLIQEGIVSANALMANTHSDLPYKEQQGIGIPFEDRSELRRSCAETARRVVSAERRQIARRFLQAGGVAPRSGNVIDELMQVCKQMMDEFYSEDLHIDIAPMRSTNSERMWSHGLLISRSVFIGRPSTNNCLHHRYVQSL